MSDKIYHKLPGTISGEDVKSAPAPREDLAQMARPLADQIFDGIALRVDQFFKAKNIQGGVRSGDDLFSPIDKWELAKSIGCFVEAQLAALDGSAKEE